jgi:hypothetical protein
MAPTGDGTSCAPTIAKLKFSVFSSNTEQFYSCDNVFLLLVFLPWYWQARFGSCQAIYHHQPNDAVYDHDDPRQLQHGFSLPAVCN